MSRSLIQAHNSQRGLTGYGAHLIRAPFVATRAAWTSISHGLRGLRLPQVVKQVIVCSSSYFSNGGDTSAGGSQRAGGGRGPNPGRQGAAGGGGGRGRGGGRTGDRPPAGDPHSEGDRTGPGRGGSRGRSPTGGRSLGGPDPGRGGGGRPAGDDRRSNAPYDPYGLQGARDLPSLAALVERHVGTWAETGNVVVLQAAFNVLGKVGSTPDEDSEINIRPHADPDLARSIMKRLAVAYMPLVPQLNTARSCVTPLWACAKLGYWEGGLAEELVRRLEDGELLRDAHGQSHSLLWWSVSVVLPDMVDLAALAKRVLRVSGRCLVRMTAEELVSQGWSNVLLACARLKWDDNPALLHHVTACLAAQQRPDHQHLANAIYSLGELAEDCRHQPRTEDLQLLAEQVVVRLGQPGSQQTQRTGKGCSPQPDVSDRGRFTPQQLSNMLLGCAKLGYKDHPTLMQSLAIAASQAARRMKPQGLANSLYALAKLGWTDTPDVQHLWSEVCQRLQRSPGSFIPQDLSNMLWALEGLRPPGWEEYAGALAAECRRRGFTGFKPQELSNSVWALASMSWGKDQDWYTAAVAAAMWPGAVASANSQDWSNLLYGLALVRHRPDAGLLQVMVAEGRERGCLATLRTSATSQACANLLWSLAVLRLYKQRLVDVLVERLGELLQRDAGQLNQQDLANSLWALVALNDADVLRRHSGLVEGLLREAVRRWAMQGGQLGSSLLPFKTEDLIQLWQVQLELMHTGLRGILQEAGGGSLLAAAGEARLESDPTISPLQRQVVGVLERVRRPLAEGQGASGTIKWVHPEYPVEGVCGRVDVVVEMADGRVVAVEVDGPWHFLANHPHTKDGSTQLRDRQLERVFGPGNVVSVPYWKWNEQRSDKQREEYLCGLLGLQAP